MVGHGAECPGDAGEHGGAAILDHSVDGGFESWYVFRISEDKVPHGIGRPPARGVDAVHVNVVRLASASIRVPCFTGRIFVLRRNTVQYSNGVVRKRVFNTSEDVGNRFTAWSRRRRKCLATDLQFEIAADSGGLQPGERMLEVYGIRVCGELQTEPCESIGLLFDPRFEDARQFQSAAFERVSHDICPDRDTCRLRAATGRRSSYQRMTYRSAIKLPP